MSWQEITKRIEDKLKDYKLVSAFDLEEDNASHIYHKSYIMRVMSFETRQLSGGQTNIGTINIRLIMMFYFRDKKKYDNNISEVENILDKLSEIEELSFSDKINFSGGFDDSTLTATIDLIFNNYNCGG